MMIRNIGIAFLLVTCLACTEQTPAVLGEPVPIVVPGDGNALGPRLSQGPNGATVLSWMERDEQGATLKYSRLQLSKWQPAATVLHDPEMFVNWADLPAVTPFTAHSLIAHWLSYSADSPYAYDIKMKQSFDDGATWSKALSPHSDNTPTEHGFVSLFATAEKAVGLIWLDGRKTTNTPGDDPTTSGMTLRGATLTPDGNVSGESVLDELICDCCQTDVAMTDQGAVAVYRNRTRDEIRDIFVTRRIGGQWQAAVAVSNDNWRIAGCPVNGPAIDGNGKRVAIAWFSAANDQPVVRTVVSGASGARFSTPVEIAADKSQGRVGVALIDDRSYAVSWLAAEEDGSYAINVRTVTMKGVLGAVKMVGRADASRIVPQMARAENQLILAWTNRIGDNSRIVSVRLPILGFYED